MRSSIKLEKALEKEMNQYFKEEFKKIKKFKKDQRYAKDSKK